MEGDDDDDAPPSSPESVTAFKCQYCGEIYMHECRLIDHKREVHAEAHQFDSERRYFGQLIGDPQLFVESSDEDEEESEEEEDDGLADDDASEAEGMEMDEVDEDQRDSSSLADPEPQLQAEVQTPAAPLSPPSLPAPKAETPHRDLSHLTDQQRRNFEKVTAYFKLSNVSKENPSEPLVIVYSDDGEILGIHAANKTFVLSPPASLYGFICEDKKLSDVPSATVTSSTKAKVDEFHRIIKERLLIDVQPIMAIPDFTSKKWPSSFNEVGSKEWHVNGKQQVAHELDCRKFINSASYSATEHGESAEKEMPNANPKYSVPYEQNQVEKVEYPLVCQVPPEPEPAQDSDSLSDIERKLERLFETGSVNGDSDTQMVHEDQKIAQSCDQVPVAKRKETVETLPKKQKRKSWRQKRGQLRRAIFAKGLTLQKRNRPTTPLRELVQLVKAGRYVQVSDRLRPTTKRLPQSKPASKSSENQPPSLLPKLPTLRITFKRPSLDSPWQVVRPDSSAPALIEDTNEPEPRMPLLVPEVPYIPSQHFISRNDSSPCNTSKAPFSPPQESPPKCSPEQTPSFTTTTTTNNSVFNCRVCVHSTRNFETADLRTRHESHVHGCLVVVDEQGNNVFTFQVLAIHNCSECSVPFRYEIAAKQHAFKCKQRLQKL